MWIALWTAANAQVPVPDLDSQLFRPSIDSRYTLWTNDSTRHEDHTLLGRVVLHYTKDPLTFYGNDGTTTRVISDIVQADVNAGYQLGPARVGIALPVLLFADGAGSPSQSGFGDLALDLKSTFVERSDNTIGFAALGRLSFPTGNIGGLKSDDPTAEVEVIVDRDFGEKWFGAVNAGVRFIPDAGLENWTDNAAVRLGLGYKTSPHSGLSAELVSHGITNEGAPSEIMLGGWGRGAKGLHLRGGLGTALGRGIGTPQLRALFAVAFEPTYEPDTDGDGLSDFDDKCKTEPEDLDGVDDSDGCPDPTPVTIAIVDEAGEPLEDATFLFEPSGAKGESGGIVKLQGGSYTLKAEAEGHDPSEATVEVQDTDAQTITVTLEETIKFGKLVVEVTDDEGNPLESTWSAKGTDYTDIQANQAEGTELLPESYQLRIGAPGYRPRRIPVTIEVGETKEIKVELSPAKVELKKERIVIDESVFFELNKATIKPESFELLDEVSGVIKDHPELLKIRIEGHTDSRGSAKSNKKLSQDRAESVKQYMIGKGVAEERLEAVGFGEEKPLDKRNNEEAWAKNRRVDFFVGKRAD